MTTEADDAIRRALDTLAAAPEPANLADRVLTRATGVRRRRAATTVAAFALAALAAVPVVGHFTPSPAGYRPGPLFGAHGPQPATATPSGGCVSLPAAEPSSPASLTVEASPGGDTTNPTPATETPSADPGTPPGDGARTPTGKTVAPADWQPFVRVALGLLPVRDDYVVQNEASWCDWPTDPNGYPSSNAYMVINLGDLREHGSLTLDIYRHYDGRVVGATCARMKGLVTVDQQPGAPSWHLDFCDAATASGPMVFGVSGLDDTVVAAVYPDGRAIVLDNILTPGTSNNITADDMRAVVTSTALIGLLPAR